MKARLVTLIALVAAASAVASGPAQSARLVATDGTYGAADIKEPGAQCYFPHGINGQYRYLIVRPPTIYAFNGTTARDWNWIRFRTHVVNTWTGTRTHTTSWSQWSLAYDNAPAQFSGTQQMAIATGSGLDMSQWAGSSVAHVEIEWWTQTHRIGGRTGEISYYEQLVAAGTQAGTISYGYGTRC